MDWIDASAASTLTGTEISESDLDAALVDVHDLIGWEPVLGTDLVGDDTETVRRRNALGRAVAWQAAYRQKRPPLQELDAKPLSSVSVGSYSESYAEGEGGPRIYPERVRRICAKAGLFHLTGNTRRGARRDDETFIPVVWP